MNTARGNILKLFLSLNALLLFIPLCLYLEHFRPETLTPTSGGKSNRFTGLLLLMAYLALAVAFFHVPW